MESRRTRTRRLRPLKRISRLGCARLGLRLPVRGPPKNKLSSRAPSERLGVQWHVPISEVSVIIEYDSCGRWPGTHNNKKPEHPGGRRCRSCNQTSRWNVAARSRQTLCPLGIKSKKTRHFGTTLRAAIASFLVVSDRPTTPNVTGCNFMRRKFVPGRRPVATPRLEWRL